MAKVADQLLKALDSLDQSPQFCVSGSLAPVLPGLEVTGVGPIGVPVSPAVARQLIERAAQAPYGRGEETIVDTNVRRVWQIEPKQLALHNPEWNGLLAGIIDSVRKEFGIKGQVNGDLYKLLVYEPGSFFAPHRDTEKVEGMFATLVVCLPSRHEGGTLIVSHDRQSKQIDFGGAQGEYKVQYVAFYADCRHEIKPVTQGYRVCLVYNLALAQGKGQPAAPRNSEKIEQVAGLLTQMFADGERQKIAITLKHEYTEAGLSLDTLKGVDRSRVDVLMRAAQRANYQAFLALMTYRQTGGVDEDTVGYGSRWGEVIDASDAEMIDPDEEELNLEHWIDAEGQPQPLGKMALDQAEIVSETAFEDFPFKQEVSEATGNEGATMERWYHSGVVVVWPADRYFGILARQGQTAAVPALEKMIAAAKDPCSDESCRTLARQIISHWKVPSYKNRESAQTATAMLQQLEQLADAELVNQFIREVLPKDYSGTEGEALCRLGDQVGWNAIAESLTHFVTVQDPSSSSANLTATVSIVEGLCCSPGRMTAPRKAACRLVATELEPTIRKWDKEQDVTAWRYKDKGREGVIESITRSFSAIDVGDLLERFLTHALADNKHYGLHAILIPAVKKMHEWTTKEAVAVAGRQQVLRHCIAELESMTAKPLEEPRDWAQTATLSCTCADCQELQQFMRDPQERTHRFRIVQARRKHLEQKLAGCDMICATDKTTSPQSLVCTKNRASHERKKVEFASNVQVLTELRGLLPRPKRKK